MRMPTKNEPELSYRERLNEIYQDDRYFRSLRLKRPSLDQFERLASMLEIHWRGRLPKPFIYPDVLGGVSLEWYLHNTETTLEINLKTLQGKYHSFNFTTEKELFRTLKLDIPSEWDWLIESIKSIQKGN